MIRRGRSDYRVLHARQVLTDDGLVAIMAHYRNTARNLRATLTLGKLDAIHLTVRNPKAGHDVEMTMQDDGLDLKGLLGFEHVEIGAIDPQEAVADVFNKIGEIKHPATPVD